MIEVFITQANAESKAKTLRAIRGALMAVGAPNTLSDASELLATLEKEGEASVGYAADEEQARNAETSLVAGGCECSLRPIDVEMPATLRSTFSERPESSGTVPTIQSTQLALVLLHALDGNPNYALQIVNAFQRITGDSATWEPVKDVLIDAFPPRSA